MNTLQLAQFKKHLLKELNVPETKDAYTFDDIQKSSLSNGEGAYYKYIYSNSLKDKMEITTAVRPPSISPSTGKPSEPGKTMYVAFGKYMEMDSDAPESEEDYEEKKYKTMTGAGDMIKVLATVVEAIRQTAEKEGGMDQIYKMAWSPADKKRKNIYDHYIETLFPNFKKDTKVSSSSFQQYINTDFNKEKKVMKEIGDASKEPYGPIDTITDDEGDRQYGFKTKSGTIYEVKVETFYRGEGKPVIARVQFGIIGEDGDISYDAQTGENDIYRIMATIVAVVKKDLKSNHADIIEFSPSKRKDKTVDKNPIDNVRTRLYSKYIKGQFKDAEVTQTLHGDIRVIL